MSYASSPYHHYISQPLKGPAIILLIILQSFILGISGATVSRLTAFYGIERETVTWFSQISAIGMVAIIPVYYRLRMYFRKVDLLLGALALQILLGISCYISNAPALMLVSNFFIGMLKLVCLLDFISLLTDCYPIMRHRAMFYGIYYTIARVGGELADILVNPVLENDNWKDIYLFSAISAGICIVLCAALFHRQRLHRKIPLYQVDWPGMLLFVTASMLLCYALTYGQSKDWFDDNSMVYALGGSILTAALFVYRQYHVKRPYWNLRVWQHYQQVPLGVGFMLVMYFFYSTNLLFNQFVGYNFKGEEDYLVKVATITLCAYLISFPLTGFLLYKGMQRRVLLSIGFLSYASSLFIFCCTIQTAVTLDQLVLPYLLQGVAYGLVLTTLSTFTATNISRKMNADRVMGSLSFRYILGALAGYSLYSNWLFRSTVQHASWLSEHFTTDNQVYNMELNSFRARYLSGGMDMQHATAAAIATLRQKLQLQGMLVSLQDISIKVAAVALFVAVAVLLIRKFEMHETKTNNSYKIV